MKKIKEDINSEELPSTVPEEIFEYISESWVPGTGGEKIPFYLVWDNAGLCRFLGISPTNYSLRDEILTDFFGEDWGFEDDYVTCAWCGKAMYNGDIFPAYTYIDNTGELYCNDCIINNSQLRDEYINDLKNDFYQINDLLSNSTLEDSGWYKIKSYDRDMDEKSIGRAYQAYYPGVSFLLSYDDRYSFAVWADEEVEPID